MGSFEQSCTEALGRPICAVEVGTLQVNLGLRCNQSCAHCHLEASPARAEAMDWPTMEQVFRAARNSRCRVVDVTGGAPELNPHFRKFVERLRSDGFAVQVRTNLTVLLEPGMQDLPEFFSSHEVQLVASMPCYTEENVRAQRGAGVYERSVAALRRLNALGYGVDERRVLNLVYNPGGAFLPGGQAALEADYRRELDARFGIRFTRLLTITNMPLGRFRETAPPRRAGRGIPAAPARGVQPADARRPDVPPPVERRLGRHALRLRLQPGARLPGEPRRAEPPAAVRPRHAGAAAHHDRRPLLRLHRRPRLVLRRRARAEDMTFDRMRTEG